MDVQNKLRSTYAAKEMLKEKTLGVCLEHAAKNSNFLGGIAQNTRDEILRMISKE